MFTQSHGQKRDLAELKAELMGDAADAQRAHEVTTREDVQEHQQELTTMEITSREKIAQSRLVKGAKLPKWADKNYSDQFGVAVGNIQMDLKTMGVIDAVQLGNEKIAKDIKKNIELAANAAQQLMEDKVLASEGNPDYEKIQKDVRREIISRFDDDGNFYDADSPELKEIREEWMEKAYEEIKEDENHMGNIYWFRWTEQERWAHVRKAWGNANARAD
jgi:hypothetical protein